MARLNHPADLPHATPIANRASNASSGSSPVISPALHPLTFEASLQSHETDILPPSPSPRSSGHTSFSPADCRTLEKLLRNTGVSSSPQTLPTPSPVEPGAQLFLGPSPSSDTSPAKMPSCYGAVGGEATDTGYDDEDDSMELSEGADASVAMTPLDDPSSLSISKSDRRLQSSVSAHDEKDRLRYTGRQSSIAKQSKTKRHSKSENKVDKSTRTDTAEDVMNLPDKRAAPVHPLDLASRNSHTQPVLNDVNPPGKLRLSLEEVLRDDRAKQKRAEHEDQLSDTAMNLNALREKVEAGDGSGGDGFDADKEDTSFEVTRPQRRKSNVSKSAQRPTTDVIPHPSKDDTLLLVPNTPITTMQSPDRTQIQSPTNRNIPETPFTKTLSYFKHFQGTENTPTKRRRNTALPQEIAEVSELAIDDHSRSEISHRERSRPAPDVKELLASSALVDLEEMIRPGESQNIVGLSRSAHEIEEPRDTSKATYARLENPANSIETEVAPMEDDNQKQLILYPQHPAFVNAIGMIPATMFWATAAPVVKYSGMAVELLIDKLRDTYL